jgi:type II secretory pathway pseudopilin PulG
MKLSFSNGNLLAILAGIVVAGAVATSIWLSPPSEIRARNLDRTRIEDLQRLDMSIKTYYGLHRALPADLRTLEGENGQIAQRNWHDPETKRPFDYEIASDTSYRLCAVFSRSSDKDANEYDYRFRNHGAGRVCFQYRVGP